MMATSVVSLSIFVGWHVVHAAAAQAGVHERPVQDPSSDAGSGAALSVPIERGQLRLRVDFDKRHGSVLFNFTFDRPDGLPAIIIPKGDAGGREDGFKFGERGGRLEFDAGTPSDVRLASKGITAHPQSNFDKRPLLEPLVSTLSGSSSTSLPTPPPFVPREDSAEVQNGGARGSPEMGLLDNGGARGGPERGALENGGARGGPERGALENGGPRGGPENGGARRGPERGVLKMFAVPPQRIIPLPDTVGELQANNEPKPIVLTRNAVDLNRTEDLILAEENRIAPRAANGDKIGTTPNSLPVEIAPSFERVGRKRVNPCFPQYLQPCASALGRDCRLISTPTGCAQCVCPPGSPAHGCLGMRALTPRNGDDYVRLAPENGTKFDSGAQGGDQRNLQFGAEFIDRRAGLMLAKVRCEDGSRAQIVHRWQRMVDPSTGHSLCVETKQPYCSIQSQKRPDEWRMPRTEDECYHYCFNREPVKTP